MSKYPGKLTEFQYKRLSTIISEFAGSVKSKYWTHPGRQSDRHERREQFFQVVNISTICIS